MGFVLPQHQKDLHHAVYDQTFRPDWSEVWTKETAEAELKDFKFKGTGWYLSKNGDTMLVTPFEPHDGNKLKLYTFHVYSGRNPADSFNWIANAPTRENKRDY